MCMSTFEPFASLLESVCMGVEMARTALGGPCKGFRAPLKGSGVDIRQV